MLKQKKPISLEQILYSFQTRIRKQEISVRKLPLSQKNNYERAVKQYIELLAATNTISRLKENRFKVVSSLTIAENQIQQDKMERDFYNKYSKIILKSLKNNNNGKNE